MSLDASEVWRDIFRYGLLCNKWNLLWHSETSMCCTASNEWHHNGYLQNLPVMFNIYSLVKASKIKYTQNMLAYEALCVRQSVKLTMVNYLQNSIMFISNWSGKVISSSRTFGSEWALWIVQERNGENFITELKRG